MNVNLISLQQFFSSEQTAPFLGKMLNTRSENVSNPSEYRLEASKAPKWSIWVPDLNTIYPLINIWKPALTDLGLKSWSMFRFWTWSIQQILTPKKHVCSHKKSLILWENCTIANKKACKCHFKKHVYL